MTQSNPSPRVSSALCSTSSRYTSQPVAHRYTKSIGHDHHDHHKPPYDETQGTASLSRESRHDAAAHASSSHEPYYSNQDIAVLHAVVAAAQEELDHAPGPRPLPAAALFKAYDRVLPQYGIDPEADQHLSTFIFRVGGERGAGTLVERFQTILGRMGIMLEFGDNNTSVSARTSRSPSFSVVESPPSRLDRPHQRLNPKFNAPDAPAPTTSLPRSPTPPPRSSLEQNPAESSPIYEMEQAMLGARRTAAASIMQRWRTAAAAGTQATQDYWPTMPRNRPQGEALQAPRWPANQPARVRQDWPSKPTAPHSALLSVMDRWRSAAANPSTGHDDGTRSDHAIEEERSISSGDKVEIQSGGRDREQPTQIKAGTPILRRSASAVRLKGTSKETSQEQPELQGVPEGTNVTGRSHLLEPEQRGSQSRISGDLVLADKAMYERLMNRAARAREIYLASRVFNHWADRTARRLEREAVARRHMIRFRCFRGWSQLPNSRSPAVSQLRTTTAVQKLRRAVVEQEEQLRTAAAAIAHELRLRTIRRIWGQWSYHLTRHTVRQKAATRSKARTLTSWILKVSDDTTFGNYAAALCRRHDETNVLHQWNVQAHRMRGQSAAALQIGASRLSVNFLRAWWDQAEIKRRAQAYRAYHLMGKTTSAMDHWGLLARAQAFIWRNDYLSVTRVFDLWLHKMQDGAQRMEQARQAFVIRSQVDFLGNMSRISLDCSTLSHLEGRARLFVGATRLLDIFNGALKGRRERERNMVRRQIMMRYQQFSGARKKRMFLSTLDHWRSLATRRISETELADGLRRTYQSRRQMASLSRWEAYSGKAQQRQSLADSHHTQTHLSRWRISSDLHDQTDMQAWSVWAARKQRQCLKEWSIASLQQGGYAHSASKLRQRHERESRKRILEQWRHNGDGPGDVESGLDPSFVLQSLPTGNYRNTWGSMSARRPPPKTTHNTEDYLASLTETPTRSNGIRLAMANTLRSQPMPPLGEADEENSPSLNSVDMADSAPGGHASGLSRADLPSTTPRAPVPIYLRQQWRSRSTQSAQLGQSIANVRPVHIWQPVANEPGVDSSASNPAPYARSYPYQPQTSRGRLAAPQLPAQTTSSKLESMYPSGHHSTKPELFAPISKSRSVGVRLAGPQKLRGQISTSRAEAMGPDSRASPPAGVEQFSTRDSQRLPTSQSPRWQMG